MGIVRLIHSTVAAGALASLLAAPSAAQTEASTVDKVARLTFNGPVEPTGDRLPAGNQRTRLPQTASTLPLVAMLGALAMAGAASIRLFVR